MESSLLGDHPEYESSNIQSASTMSYQINDISSMKPFSDKTRPFPGNIGKSILCVDRDGTFLNLICSKRQTANIIHLLFHRTTLIMLGIINVAAGIVSWTHISYTDLQTTDNFLKFAVAMLYAMSSYIYIPLVLLSLNRRVTASICKTFEFWFKMAYSIQYLICFSVKWKAYSYQHADFVGTMMAGELTQIPLVLLVILFSLVDGLQIPLRFKIIVLILWSIVFTAFMIHFMVLQTRSGNRQDYIDLFGYFTVDVVSLQSSSLKIICIFLWKQAVLSVYRRDESTMLSEPVIIQWR